MKKGLRRVAAVAVAALVVAPALATAASATPTFAFDRQAGIDRYATSVAVATTYGASTNVILASGVPGHFPDALTASYLAGVKQAPIMLTQLAATPANVLARIAASGATDVWLIGGTGVISAAQEAALDVTYTVHRLGGLDRYLTSAAVIAEGGTSAATAVLATGVNFPDALAGGPLAYARDMPLAITATNTLPASTLSALKAAGVTSVIALGGPTVISAGVLATLAAQTPSITATRIFGANRSETSSLFATELITNRGFSNTAVNVASGYAAGTGADALGGAPLSGKELRPTLITESVTTVGPGPLGYLTAHAATLTTGHIFGGTGAVSQASEDAMEAAARGLLAGSNQTFTVAPTTAATIVGSDNDTTPATDENIRARTYTANVGTATSVSIGLVDPADVTVTGGLVTFEHIGVAADLLTDADTGVEIASVNGTNLANNAVSAASISPVAGVVTFTLDGDINAFGEAIPVVYTPTGGVFAVDTTGAPTAAFGIGGQITVTPIEAVAGTFTGAVVDAISTGSFVATVGTVSGTYRYSTADTFRMGANVVTQARFLAALSVGDTLTIVYDPAGVDTYTITADKPGAPTIGTATPNDSVGDDVIDEVLVTFTNPVNVYLSDYEVFRATVTGTTVGTFAEDTTATFTGSTVNTLGTASAAMTATLDLPAAGTYVYKVRAVGVGGGAAATGSFSAVSNSITVAAAPGAISGIAPNGFVVTTDTTDGGSLGTGDVLTATFASAVAVNGSATITVVNNLGETAVVTQGASTATFAVATNVLTVTLLAPPAQTTGTAPFSIAAATSLQLNDTSGITGASNASTLPNLRINTTDAQRTALAGTMPAAPTAVTASASADTVTATVAANGFVRVYNETGRTLLATSPVRATAGPITFAVPALVAGQNILVVQSIDGATSLVESIAATSVVTAAVNEVQTVTATGTVTGGTFTLAFGANTTAALAFNASAATVQTALQGLASIGAGNATVTLASGVYTVTFTGTLAATDVAALVADSTSITGGGTYVVATPTTGAAAVTAPGTTVS